MTLLMKFRPATFAVLLFCSQQAILAAAAESALIKRDNARIDAYLQQFSLQNPPTKENYEQFLNETSMSATQVLQKVCETRGDYTVTFMKHWTLLIKQNANPFVASTEEGEVNAFVSAVKRFKISIKGIGAGYFLFLTQCANAVYEDESFDNPLLTFDQVKHGIKESIAQLLCKNGFEVEFDLLINHLCVERNINFIAADWQDILHAAQNVQDENKFARIQALAGLQS